VHELCNKTRWLHNAAIAFLHVRVAPSMCEKSEIGREMTVIRRESQVSDFGTAGAIGRTG